MTVTANGKARQLPPGTTVLEFLAQCNLAPERVIVERNGAPLRRERFAEAVLQAGDKLEIAQMVGGG